MRGRRRLLRSRRNYADEYAMPKLLRPRSEFPTPLFVVFCCLCTAGVAAWIAWRLVG